MKVKHGEICGSNYMLSRVFSETVQLRNIDLSVFILSLNVNFKSSAAIISKFNACQKKPKGLKAPAFLRVLFSCV